MPYGTELRQTKLDFRSMRELNRWSGAAAKQTGADSEGLPT